MTARTLTAAQQANLEQVMTAPESPQARLTVWELITQKYIHAGPLFDTIHNHYAYQGLPDEQLLATCWFGAVSGDGIHMPTCLTGGIARRFLLASPLELALRLSVAARYEWYDSQINGNHHPEELFRPLLHAAASHDVKALERIARLPVEALAKPNNREYALIMQALLALVHGHEPQLQQAAEAMRKRKPHAYVKAIQAALIAVAENAPEGFAAAYEKMLKAYPNYMFKDEVYRLVDPHALGLYELVRTHRPGVEAAFDTTRALPWDADYHTWLATCPDIAAHYEGEKVPEQLRKYIVDLEPLDWAPTFLATLKQNLANAPPINLRALTKEPTTS